MTTKDELLGIVRLARHFPGSLIQSNDWEGNDGTIRCVEFLQSCDYCGNYLPCLWVWDHSNDEEPERVACPGCRNSRGLNPLTLRRLAQ